MHNKVVYHAMKVLNAPEWGLGWPVLRFNFRGTGLSEGTHDGEAEAGDVLRRWTGSKRISNGRSSSSDSVLAQPWRLPPAAIVMRMHRHERMFAHWPPSACPSTASGLALSLSVLSKLHVSKLFLSGDRDQFAPATESEAVGRCGRRPQADGAHSRRRSFFYRSTGGDAARALRLAEGANAMTPASDTALDFCTQPPPKSSPAPSRPATSPPHSTAAFASRATRSSA